MKNYTYGMFIFLSVCFCTSLQLQSRTVIPGNASDANATFSIPISNFLGYTDGRLLTSATTAGAGTFAIAQFNRLTRKFEGIAYEKIQLDGKADTANPLFNQSVAHIATLQATNAGSSPIVAIPSNAPGTAYYIETPQNILSCTKINDAQGNQTGGIIQITGSLIGRTFAAVLPQTGSFGDPGSGITVLGTAPKPDGKVAFVALPKAAALDTTTPATYLGNPLTALSQPISLWWDTVWALRSGSDKVMPEPLYCGIGSVISGPLATDGASSVVLGIHTSNGIGIGSIFDPHANFTNVGTDKIIIAMGSEVELSVHHISTIWTSTNTRYLVIVGGNGSPATTNNQVYAIPLLSAGPNEGRLASKQNSQNPALTTNDLATAADSAALVGNGPLLAGPISHMFTRNDLVCAVVSEGLHQGIYCSQPIFAANGAIIQWTTWHRATSSPASPFNGSLNLVSGNWFILTSNDPLGANQPNTITSTDWDTGDSESFGPAITQLNSLFTQNQGGIEGLATFNADIPGLSNTALLAAYGDSTIALVETGVQNNDGIYTPTDPQTFADILTYTDSTVSTTPTNQTILAFTGGLLPKIGVVTSVAIGHSTIANDSWLFVGGTHGLGVLAQPTDFSGWGNELGNHFAGITAGMQLIPLGSYKFINKLVVDGDYLYVLTNSTLDRINLNASLSTPDITTIATVNQLRGLSANDTFTDCMISAESLGLLATNRGLYRIANNESITMTQPSWTPFPLPEQELPITHLFAVTKTGNDSDIARYGGSNVYVVSGNQTDNRTVINRIAVGSLGTNMPVEATTVQIFTVDSYILNTSSYCINYGKAEQLFALDGALTYAVHNSDVVVASSLSLLAYNYPLRSNFRFIGIRAVAIKPATSDGELVSSLIQHNVSGSWMLGTRQGVRINE